MELIKYFGLEVAPEPEISEEHKKIERERISKVKP